MYVCAHGNSPVPTTQLEQDLKAGALKGGDEDSVVVSRVLEVYLKPMQEAMLEVAPVMQLAGREARERARLLPSIMQVRDGASPFHAPEHQLCCVDFVPRCGGLSGCCASGYASTPFFCVLRFSSSVK